jgi:NADPH-dependent 2,4-dienoyl-CoA reductase/sulfur reductase-like enzyme
MTTALERVVIVGASLAGLRAAEALRRSGYEGSLVLVGEEHRLPYDRPPLSKEVLQGRKAADATRFRPQEHFDDLGIELQLGRRCYGLDPHARRIQTGDGYLDFDGCIIATGTSPRRFRDAEALEGVHVIRTADDALAISDALARDPRVAVVGAGFIGSEVAASVRSRGLDVTLVEALAAPLVRAVGEDMARVCAQLHTDHGTRLLCGVEVERLEGSGHVERVILSDGSWVDADLVIVGIGVSPNVGWLVDSGLPIGDGVVCDATLRAGHPNIFACGDVASWPNPLFGATMRCEHWTNATEQGIHAARNLLARPEHAQPYRGANYFWSDQYGIRIQSIGRTTQGAVEVVAGSLADREFLACFREGDRLAGAFAMNSPRLLTQARLLFERDTPWDLAVSDLRS